MAEVERELHRRLTPVEREGESVADHLREHEPDRSGEEQAEEQRDLPERDGVRVPLELDVHHEDLGDEAGHGSTGGA